MSLDLSNLASALPGSRISKYLPVPNATESFWQRDIHELNDHRSTEQLPEHSDIVIIGAGYAGVSTAYHLVKDHVDTKSITILEARGACSGATGRNGGHMRPDLYGHIPTYVNRAGPEAAAEIAEFEIAHVHAIKKVIEEEKIDCDFTLTRSIDVWCNEEAAKNARTIYDEMVAHGFEYMDDVIFYTGKDAEGVSQMSLPRRSTHLLIPTDLRGQRRCGSCIIHCRDYLAVQIHPAPGQVDSFDRQGELADTHPGDSNNPCCNIRLHHRDSSGKNPRRQGHSRNQRLCVGASPGI
jgi:hypothetical protein